MARKTIVCSLGLIGLAVAFSIFVARPALAKSTSPVRFSIGDYAGDFVKEKVNGRIWYIDAQDSRRYQILAEDPGLFERLKAVAQPKAWNIIYTIPENGKSKLAYKNKSGLRGLIFDPTAPDLLWHIQRRAYKRQALSSNEDVLAYVQKAMVVDGKDLAEYPIAYANFDYTVADPAKKPDLTASSTRPDLPKFIRVSLKEQRLRAYEYGKLVDTFLISSGKGKYPSPHGDFSVLDKDPVVDYIWSYSPGNPDNFDLGDVPYNLRYTGHKYIHYAYWHHNFGHPMSHGCINVSLSNSKWIYRWADKGVPVSIH